jgi:hypothetical protein
MVRNTFRHQRRGAIHFSAPNLGHMASMERWESFENGSALASRGAEWLRESVAVRRETHGPLVAAVQATILSRKPGQKVSIRKPGINHTPHSRDYKKTACLVDVTRLSSILRCGRCRQAAHERQSSFGI